MNIEKVRAYIRKHPSTDEAICQKRGATVLSVLMKEGHIILADGIWHYVALEVKPNGYQVAWYRVNQEYQWYDAGRKPRGFLKATLFYGDIRAFLSDFEEEVAFVNQCIDEAICKREIAEENQKASQKRYDANREAIAPFLAKEPRL